MKFLESSVGRWLKEGSNETVKFWQGTFRNRTTSARPAVRTKQKAPVTEQPTVYTSASQTDGYGLDSQANESRWGLNLPHPSRSALGLTQPPTQSVPG
jgi:hypothetical protein